MEMIKVEIEIPKDMKPFMMTKNTEMLQKRNALLLYPYIENDTISHGRAAEILGIHKLDLIALYGQMGLPYFDMDIDETIEDMKTIAKLHQELNKGIQSMKNGEVFTIEEAWEEIDK